MFKGRRKYWYLIFLLPLIGLAAAFDHTHATIKECPFCNKQILGKQEILTEGKARVFMPYKPIVRGHLLVIPVRHVERFEDLTDEEILDIAALIRKVEQVSQTDYILLQKNGKNAGQSVFHVHIHILPRPAGQGWFSFLLRSAVIPWLKPVCEKKLQEEIAMWRKLLRRL